MHRLLIPNSHVLRHLELAMPSFVCVCPNVVYVLKSDDTIIAPVYKTV